MTVITPLYSLHASTSCCESDMNRAFAEGEWYSCLLSRCCKVQWVDINLLGAKLFGPECFFRECSRASSSVPDKGSNGTQRYCRTEEVTHQQQLVGRHLLQRKYKIRHSPLACPDSSSLVKLMDVTHAHAETWSPLKGCLNISKQLSQQLSITV